MLEVSKAKRRLLEILRRGVGSTVRELAEQLGLSEMAVRQHLSALEKRSLVELGEDPRRKPSRGRPASVWTITSKVTEVFEERNADLALSILDATRASLGEEGLSKVLAARKQAQVKSYRSRLPKAADGLARTVRSLANLRTEEGYEAEARSAGGGKWLLIERHCPICAVALECQGICATELELFQEVVGTGVLVERTEHLVSGDVRCVYRFKTRTAKTQE